MKATSLVKVFFCLFVSFLIIGCEKEEEKPGAIYGMITDFSTGEPVSSANVQLRPSGETTLTGTDGMYEFPEVAMGSYSIMVSKAEYSDLVDDYVIEVKEGKRVRRDAQIKKQPVALHLYDNEGQEISELDFGSDEGVTQKTFNIFNGGAKKIDYTIGKTADWISEISQSSGTINIGATKPIVVTINRRLLAAGDNNTILTITSSEGGGKELTVKARNTIELPTVSISEAIDIDSITYRIKCEVVSDGGLEVTERGICWNTYGDPTMDDETIAYTSGGTGLYTIRMDHLTMATHYYVRAYAKNNIGVGLSEVVDFLTGAVVTLPVVSTLEVADVTATSALCNGNVTDDGGATLIERGVCWGINANPSISGQHKAANGATTGVFSVSITGLTANTTYHVRAYAKNSRGTAYGQDLTFTTVEGLPVVSTSNITNITTTSAVGGGNVINQGASLVTERGVCWSTVSPPTLNDNHAQSGNGTGSYTVNITDLTPETKYYVRSYAINAQGTAYGEQKEFTTIEVPTYSVSVSANPSNGGSVSGGGTYQQGQSCTVTATANNGYTFTNWTENGSQVSANSSYTFTVNSNRTLVANYTVVPQAPTGAINGLFSVSSSKQVWFSKGNLQYIGSTTPAYWKFAENQWDYLGTSTGQNSGTTTVDRDLFGWATSGYYCGSSCYMPYDINNSYSATYGPSYSNLTGEYANADWGVYNAIENGGNAPGMWRTLSSDEWTYVMAQRDTPSKILFAKAVVNGVNGVVLLPDDWVGTNFTLAFINNKTAHYDSNVISENDWNNFLEPKGAVFLPAAGTRNGATVSYLGSNGMYWSSSVRYSDTSCAISFTDTSMGQEAMILGAYAERKKYSGGCVRLVQDVE